MVGSESLPGTGRDQNNIEVAQGASPPAPIEEFGLCSARTPPAAGNIIALSSSHTIQDKTPGQGYLIIVRSSIKSISY